MLIVHDPTPLLKTFMEHQPAHEFAQDQPLPLPDRPAHLFEGGSSAVLARNAQRRERAAVLKTWWASGDKRTFSLFAGEALWDDPALAELLPADAAAYALTLVSQAAIRLHRQRLR